MKLRIKTEMLSIKKQLARVLSILGIVAIFLFCTDFSFGSETAEHHVPSIWDLKWFWINFVIYVSLLYWLLKEKTVHGWNARVLRIQAAVSKGRAELSQAESKLREVKSKFADLDANLKKLREGIQKETEREYVEILEDAKKKATRIISQAEDLVKTERRLLERELQDEMTAALLLRAREKLEKELNIENDRQFRERAISGLTELVQ